VTTEKRKAEQRLEELLLEGLESEESPLTKQDFEDIRKEALAQLKRRKKEELTVPAVRKRASAKRDQFLSIENS